MSAPVRAWVQSLTPLAVRRLERSIERADREGQSVLPVYINSPGGSVAVGMAMADLITQAPITIATIGLGWADSCGAMLLACGTRGSRYVAENCEVMVHEMRADTGYQAMANVENEAKYLAALNKQFLGILDKHTRKRPGHWLRHVRKHPHSDHYFTPAEAVKAGLADHVGLPRVEWTASLSKGAP
jgi:ATP-dependent Clp protease protease subunit